MKTAKTMKSLFFIGMMAVVISDFALADEYVDYCSTYYAPCTCHSTWASGEMIKCINLSSVTIQSVFSKPPSKIDAYFPMLYLAPNTNNIVAKITGNRTFDTMYIDCNFIPNRKLAVNSAAFTSTKMATSDFEIYNCDLSNLNWSFLTNFSNLKYIFIYDSSNPHTTFSTLPAKTLTSLMYFSLIQVKGINGFGNTGLKYPDYLPNGLRYVVITRYYYPYKCLDCMIGDVALEKLLKWITPSSNKTLINLILSENNLTRIPSDVFKYKFLINAEFVSNIQPLTIQSNAFNLYGLISSNINSDRISIDFTNSKISTIASDAFKGNYSTVRIKLDNNNLSRFPSSTFQAMVKQMNTSTEDRFIGVYRNPFNCTVTYQCELAWLIRIIRTPSQYDNGPVRGARCSNGTYFYQLNSNALRTTSGKPCP